MLWVRIVSCLLCALHFTAHPCTRILFLQSPSKASHAKLTPDAFPWWAGLCSVSRSCPFFPSTCLPVCVNHSQNNADTQILVCFCYPQLTDLSLKACLLQSSPVRMLLSTPYLWPHRCSHMFFIKPLLPNYHPFDGCYPSCDSKHSSSPRT